MEELTEVLQQISTHLQHIRWSISSIAFYLFLMLCFKDMGNGAKDAIRSLKNKIQRK